MRNYALITTAIGALLFGLTVSSNANSEDALAGTLPVGSAAAAEAPASSATAPAPVSASSTATAPATAGSQVFVPAAGASTTATAPTVVSGVVPSTVSTTTSASSTTTSTTLPSSTTSSAIVPVTPASTSALAGTTAVTGSGNGLTTSPATPQVVQDAMTRLQKVDQINLDDMIRAQDAINRLDLLLEIEKRQTELKKIRDERNKPAVTAAAAAGLLGSAIPASALNLPKISAPVDSPSSSSSSSSVPSYTPKTSKSSSSGSTSGPNEKYTIKRITGSDGRYYAVINTDDNGSQTVRSGDKLPDGSLVKSVSLTSVSLFKDKKSKTLTIPTDSYIVRESGNSSQ